MTPFLDLAILHLATRIHATAAEIDIACWMRPAEARARLGTLESTGPGRVEAKGYEAATFRVLHGARSAACGSAEDTACVAV